MPSIVRNIGDLKKARNVDGEMVYRQDALYLQSYGWLPCLNTDNHFIHKSKRLGSSIICTCGSPGVIMGYHAYKKYTSFMGSEVIMCHHFFQFGRHADNST